MLGTLCLADGGDRRDSQCCGSGEGGDESELSTHPQVVNLTNQLATLMQSREELGHLNRFLKHQVTMVNEERRMWERRFELLLDRVLCWNCVQDKKGAYLHGTYEEKRSWTCRNCPVCEVYKYCFPLPNELSDTEREMLVSTVPMGARKTSTNPLYPHGVFSRG